MAWPLDRVLLPAEGSIEIRACPVCHKRLVGRTGDLGQILACPHCGTRQRALAAEGPFADSDQKQLPSAEPEAFVELVAVEPAAAIGPNIAPVVPIRHQDPIDDRSPMVNAMANLQWATGAFLFTLAVYTLGTFWKREHTTRDEELSIYFYSTSRIVLAIALNANTGGILRRTRTSLWIAIALSLLILGIGVADLIRASGEKGFRARFDYGLLLELPILLMVLVILVILITPRYRQEFYSNPLFTQAPCGYPPVDHAVLVTDTADRSQSKRRS